MLNEVQSLDQIKLLRCIIQKDCGDYFKAKDYQNNKYIIAKNKVTANYKKGTDNTFYAIKETKGKLIKREIYHPISSNEFLDIKDKLDVKIL